ncbi:integrin alpha-X-like [Protobothrops mucrosquamatus]|uniref:integrin alpha-X-like n=1 Tax=Protobothrops mucrosquamatus TaxID=103944 RepID=UPI0010FB458B|nr:integrin alpha-X-like [Protobothrops mucrosquamatus]
MGPVTKVKFFYQAVFLLCLGCGLQCFSSFSLFDFEAPVIFLGEKTDQFGYRVIQTRSGGTSWLVVSAPFANNRTGSLFRCSYDTQKCQSIVLNHIPRISLGVSLAADEASESKIMACGPTWERRCGQLDYLNGICYILNDFDGNVKKIQPTFQECVFGVDAVILYDDSGSISDHNLRIMKDFFLNLMDSVAGANVQFAVVQYSSIFTLVFDFATYNNTREKIKDLIHNFGRFRGETYTPSAIVHVVDKVFTVNRGVRPHSKKLLIVLTDGISNDRSTTFKEATEAANKKGIIRYAIGVGQNFLTAQDELRRIASSNENVFPVESFDALDQLQKQLEDKIFNIEGVSKPLPDALPSSFFEKEFSQGGFSSLLTPEHAVTGAVGAYSWTGGLEEASFGEPPQIKFLNVSIDESYIGYSVALARFHQRTFYITGAPRYQHVGQVLVFESKSGSLIGNIQGQQVGSYFGAELASVDLNEDGNTDLLLIGAPHYYNGSQGGNVHVSSINSTGNLVHLQTLHGVPDNGLGLFGAALAALGDISGDGLTDVAVGAPMENENRGAIYIFLGEADRLKEVHSQRISATSVSPVLQFFGQSIQGRLDLSRDELTDLAIGALGSAVVLRSRPVFTVLTSLRFSRDSIPLDDPDCGSRKISRIDSRGQVSLCFTLTLLSMKWSSGSLKARIDFSLHVDVKQTLPRLMLENETPSFSDSLQIGIMPICINKTLWAQVCLDDSFSPVVLQTKLSVQEQPVVSDRNLRPVLHPETKTSMDIEVPFQKDCGEDGICVSDLSVSFNFSGSKGLKLSPNFILNLTVELKNLGELAYEPVISFYYSSVLSFQGASVLQSNWPLFLACQMHRSQGNDTVRHSSCRFRPPALKGGTRAFLWVSFRSSKGDTWPDKFVYFTIRAQSQNESNMQNNEATGRLPVLYPINVIVKELQSTAYLNFSTEDPGKKILTHSYEVRNFDSNSTAVNVTFELPLMTKQGFFWNITPSYSNVKNHFSCTPLFTLRTGINRKNVTKPIKRGCQGAVACPKVYCFINSLAEGEWIRFNFSGDFYREDKSLKLKYEIFHVGSEASIRVDETRFFLNEQEGFHFSQIFTQIELISPFNPVPIIIGSTIGGIVLLAIIVAVLYKFGFFKRKRVPQMDANAAGAAAPSDQAPATSAAS